MERGLAPTRARAQAAVLAGRVRVDGKVSDKPGMAIDADRSIEVLPSPEFVSRGGLKLDNALRHFDVDVTLARRPAALPIASWPGALPRASRATSVTDSSTGDCATIPAFT